MEIKIKGCVYEDFDEMKRFMLARDMSSAIWESRQMIHSRLKYSPDLSDEEERFLEDLRESLFVEGLEPG